VINFWTQLCTAADFHYGIFVGYSLINSHRRTLHVEQHKHRINAHRRTCLEWYSNPRSQCSSERRQFIVHAFDRAPTVIGYSSTCVYLIVFRGPSDMRFEVVVRNHLRQALHSVSYICEPNVAVGWVSLLSRRPFILAGFFRAFLCPSRKVAE
jgi:hypothetical protein